MGVGLDFPKEDAELEHQLVRGDVLSFDELTAEPPRADESGEGWDAHRDHALRPLRGRLWDGAAANGSGLRR